MAKTVGEINEKVKEGKAGGEWTLVCLVYNIKKIYAKIMAKGGD